MAEVVSAQRTIKSSISIVTAAFFVSFFVAIGLYHSASAAPLNAVTDVATGAETACAVTDGKVACWGRGDSGQLGNGVSKDASKPVYAVAKDAWTETVPSRKECSFVFFCNTIPESKIDHPRTPLGLKYISKVSVGKDHACAIASARAYCWGNNSSGQLGNRSTSNSNVPVAVDIAALTPAIPGYCKGSSGIFGCAWPNGTWVNEVPAIPASSLLRKEVIDISAGDRFTCALSSDGTVSCWGEGDNGRLGTNNTTDATYPKSVYIAAGSALDGKVGARLAKASGQTMCVLAVNKGQATNAGGSPYCWGKGIDGGQAIPANGNATVACGKTSPTFNPANSGPKTTIFESNKPTAVPGATLTAMDGQEYVTALGADKKAYYWGMYGYKETATFSNVKSCKVNPCTGKVVIQREQDDITNIVLAATKKTTTTKKTTGGSVSTTKRTTTTSKGSVTSHTSITAKPNTTAGQTTNSGGNGSNKCNAVTHYGYTKSVVNDPVGKKVVTSPPAWPQSQSGYTTLSGNVYSGLFCAANSNGAQCDAHGTDVAAGQTGSGYTPQCTVNYAYNIFGQKYESGRTCAVPPTGPQTVTTNGWLAGKQLTQLSTGSTGYTCAIASKSVGCWGANAKGQLGSGDTTNRNIPTEIGQ